MMFGLENKEKREQAEFIVKSVTLVVSALWILIMGTAFLQKEGMRLDLRNKALGVESMPTADTDMSIEMRNPPVVQDDVEFCTVTGLYSIKNIGRLALQIDRVVFELYELPVVRGQERVTSFSAARLIGEQRPIHREVIPVDEVIGVTNRVERAFGFVVRRDRNAMYVVVASGDGGLVGAAQDDRTARFGPRDLQHLSPTGPICPVSSPAPFSPPAPPARS
jgi:hypothetical protein